MSISKQIPIKPILTCYGFELKRYQRSDYVKLMLCAVIDSRGESTQYICTSSCSNIYYIEMQILCSLDKGESMYVA